MEECDYAEGVAFHLRVLQLDDPVGFQSEYVGATGKKLLKQVLQDHGIQLERDGGAEPRDTAPEEADRGLEETDKKALAASAKAKSGRERGKGGGEKIRKRTDAPGPGEEDRHAELRKKLDEIRRGRDAGQDTAEADPGLEAPGERLEATGVHEKVKRLSTGRKLPVINADLDDFLRQAREATQTGRGGGMKRPREKADLSGIQDSIANQLALQASVTAKGPSPPRGGAPGAGGTSTKKKKKKKGKKKKKKSKRRAHGGGNAGGGPGGGSSPSSSSTSSSSRSSRGRSPESSSADSLRPPLQRRSRKEAGSVLKLLIKQVEEQLSELQGADSGGGALLGGTKMVSYYHLMIKAGGLQVGGRDGRELFLLANLIDLLRMGKLALLGDGLASRFLAIQQAMIDNHWGAARHLEIYTPEVQTAAGASMTLEARRHARLIEKAQGYKNQRGKGDSNYTTNWQKGSSWASNAWDGYGESTKGKGKKGKGKAKGGYGQGKGGGQWRGGSAWESAAKGGEREKGSEKDKPPEK